MTVKGEICRVGKGKMRLALGLFGGRGGREGMITPPCQCGWIRFTGGSVLGGTGADTGGGDESTDLLYKKTTQN